MALAAGALHGRGLTVGVYGDTPTRPCEQLSLPSRGTPSSALRLSAMRDELALRDAVLEPDGRAARRAGQSPLANYDKIRRLRELATANSDGRDRRAVVAALARFEAATGAVGGESGRRGRDELRHD